MSNMMQNKAVIILVTVGIILSSTIVTYSQQPPEKASFTGTVDQIEDVYVVQGGKFKNTGEVIFTLSEHPKLEFLTSQVKAKKLGLSKGKKYQLESLESGEPKKGSTNRIQYHVLKIKKIN